MTPDHALVCFIGAGASGAAAATVLTGLGVRAVILERGPWRGRETFGADEFATPSSIKSVPRDVENLYVVDGATFPTGTGANPALSIMANVWRVAVKIAAARGKPRPGKVDTRLAAEFLCAASVKPIHALYDAVAPLLAAGC